MKGSFVMDKDYFNMNAYNVPPYFGFDSNIDSQNSNPMDNTFFNPLMQYEQAYMYYRYLSQQMEYKIKCKEYEKLTSNAENRQNGRKIE